MDDFKSAVILAGGRSTRMGFDKQLLKVKDRGITQHLISELQGHFSDIMISTRTPWLYENTEARPIKDIYEDLGPLAGIHAALRAAICPWVFVIACDMPFIEKGYIDYMISHLRGKAYDACVTERQSRIEPFHGFYCRTGLEVLEDDLSQKKASIYYYTKKINTFTVSEKTASTFLPGWRAFTNLNTRQEYEKFRREGA